MKCGIALTVALVFALSLAFIVLGSAVLARGSAAAAQVQVTANGGIEAPAPWERHTVPRSGAEEDVFSLDCPDNLTVRCRLAATKRAGSILSPSTAAAGTPALASPVAASHSKEENLIASRNADFENADGRNEWSGYCGNPRVTREVAHTGNRSLCFPASAGKQMFCAPKLNLPRNLLCGMEYRLTLWVTIDATWVRKSKPESRVGHHSHFMLNVKANGVQRTCNFKSEEFLFVCAQSVNLATGGRWVKLDGLIQFGYGDGDSPPANQKQIGPGPSFHVDGVDRDASVYIDDVVLVKTGRVQTKESHDAAWAYAKSNARAKLWAQPPNQLVDVPKEDVFPFPRSNLSHALKQ